VYRPAAKPATPGRSAPQNRCAADTFIRLDLLAHTQFHLHCRPRPERPCTTNVATERSGGRRHPTAGHETQFGDSRISSISRRTTRPRSCLSRSNSGLFVYHVRDFNHQVHLGLVQRGSPFQLRTYSPSLPVLCNDSANAVCAGQTNLKPGQCRSEA
jgi:hypothetical protein